MRENLKKNSILSILQMKSYIKIIVNSAKYSSETKHNKISWSFSLFLIKALNIWIVKNTTGTIKKNIIKTLFLLLFIEALVLWWLCQVLLLFSLIEQRQSGIVCLLFHIYSVEIWSISIKFLNFTILLYCHILPIFINKC